MMFIAQIPWYDKICPYRKSPIIKISLFAKPKSSHIVQFLLYFGKEFIEHLTFLILSIFGMNFTDFLGYRVFDEATISFIFSLLFLAGHENASHLIINNFRPFGSPFLPQI